VNSSLVGLCPRAEIIEVPRSGREAGTPITFELGMTEQGKPQVM